jgi:hypothetical protein
MCILLQQLLHGYLRPSAALTKVLALPALNWCQFSIARKTLPGFAAVKVDACIMFCARQAVSQSSQLLLLHVRGYVVP